MLVTKKTSLLTFIVYGHKTKSMRINGFPTIFCVLHKIKSHTGSKWQKGEYLSVNYTFKFGFLVFLLTCLKLWNGTNWTMSLRTGSPLGERSIPSSPSSICMSLKSAFPTPTMMTDMGKWEAWTMASLVSAISVITPSVRISSMKYSYRRWEKTEKMFMSM